LINKKPIYFLLSFGHCGIDWLHSLLDSHPEILIMPAFDYYRNWKLLEADKALTPKSMADLWTDFLKSEKMQSRDTKVFYRDGEEIIFNNKLRNTLKSIGISRKKTLFAIHETYAHLRNIDLNNIKCIVLHVHVVFPIYEIIKDFTDPNLLMIVRDPRASFAGWFHVFKKKFGQKHDYYMYFMDQTINEWLMSIDIFKKYNNSNNNNLFVVKNENMVNDLKTELLKISNWMNVQFNETMLYSTFPSGDLWIPDSGYISKDGKYPESKGTYFLPENVKNRWLKELSDEREILMIEFLTNDIMRAFDYKRIYKDSLLNRLKGLWYFLLPHRGEKRLKWYPPDENEFDRIYSRLVLLDKLFVSFFWKFSPKLIKSFYIWFGSILLHIYYYFTSTKDRWKRYDNPLVEHLYRNY
jgi:hypothetical protein